MAKGFAKPIQNNPSNNVIPDDIIDAHNELHARCKLSLILRSHAVTELPISVGDLVEVYSKAEHEKRGKWSLPKLILSINHDARSLTVQGKNHKTRTVSIEDIRLATPDHSLAKTVQEGIDILDDYLEDLKQGDSNYETESAIASEGITEDTNSSHNDDFSTDDLHGLPSVGDKISVFWPLYDTYYDGTVGAQQEENGNLTINYEDGETECLNMTEEEWKYTNTINASSSNITTNLEVTCTEQEVLKNMVEHFGNKSFLKHKAQGFDQFSLVNSYKAEEENFLKTFKIVSNREIPDGANIISSYTLYKVKHNDDGSLKLKAPVAPHGNEDAMKDMLGTDCSTCPPTGLRIVESIAALVRMDCIQGRCEVCIFTNR